MIRNLCGRKHIFLQSWKLPEEVIERMELIKNAIENLRQDILKEIPEVIDYRDDIKILQFNIMEIQKDINLIQSNFESLSQDVQELLDAPDVVIPEPKTEVINKYFTKRVYCHNLWVYGAVATSIVLGILGILY